MPAPSVERETDDMALWPRIEQAIYATTVSRVAIDFDWPECHRKNCPHRHGSPDEAFRMFTTRVAETVRRELLTRCISDPAT